MKFDSEKSTTKLTPMASALPISTGMKYDAMNTVAVLAMRPVTCAARNIP